MSLAARHRICQCTSCRFRFPVVDREAPACPRCGACTCTVVGPFGEHPVLKDEPAQPQPHIEGVLDNIRSIFNVGSMFRTADGAGIRHLHLCGITPTPANPRLQKTALGAQEVVAWSHSVNALHTALRLQEEGYSLWALEGGRRALPLSEAGLYLTPAPIALVIGNEVSGIDPAILELCPRIFAIPMQGVKTSLNAAVAFGIAVYTLRFAGNDG